MYVHTKKFGHSKKPCPNYQLLYAAKPKQTTHSDFRVMHVYAHALVNGAYVDESS